MATLDEVISETSNEKTMRSSVSKLMAGIRDQVIGALSGVNLPPSVTDKIAEIFEDLLDNEVKLVSAIHANVPATDPDSPHFDPENPDNALFNDPDEPNYNPLNPIVKRARADKWGNYHKGNMEFDSHGKRVENDPRDPKFDINKPFIKQENDPKDANFNPNRPTVKPGPAVNDPQPAVNDPRDAGFNPNWPIVKRQP